MLRKTQLMSREIYMVFNLLALFVITYILVDTFYRVINIKLYETTAPKVVSLEDAAMQANRVFRIPEYSMIVKRNIFGAKDKVDPPPVEKKVEQKVEPVETLEETSLRLSLLGTIAGDEQSSRAIILDQRTRSQDIYRVGDSVQQASIKQILRGKIILRHGEKNEVLSMAGDDEVVMVSAKTEDRGRSSEMVSTSFPLTPLFERRAEQQGKPYRSARVVSQEVPMKETAEKTGMESVTTEKAVMAAEAEPVEKVAGPETGISVAPPIPKDATIPVTETQASVIPAAKTMAKLQEPSIADAKLPDFNAVEPFVGSWSEAWKQKNIETYLSHYAADFIAPGGMSRAAWEKQRHQRLARPEFIKIKISDMQKQKVNDSRAQVTFIQEYQSDYYADKVVKTLELVWENGSWRIMKETSQAL